MEPVKAGIEAFKKARHEAKRKKQLIKNLDYGYFQEIINSLADNQSQIGINIHLPDGTIIKLKKETHEYRQMRDPYAIEEVMR